VTPRSVDAGPGADVVEVSEPSDAAPPAAESTKDRISRYARVTKDRADVLRDRASDQLDRMEAQRDRHATYDLVFGVRDDDERVAGRELAAALAYRLFFLMLPMVLIVVGGLGVTGSSDKQAAADAVRESGASAAVARNIATATAELSFLEHFVVLGIGVFGTYLAGRGLIKTLSRVNAVAWSVPLAKPAKPMRTLCVVLGLVLVLILLSNAWNQLRTELGTLEFLLALPVTGVLYAIVVTTLHAQLPRPDAVPWRDLIPGALLVGIVIAAMQALVLGYIARKLSSSNELYGGIGTAIALLVWLYLLGRVLVLGPLLDVVLWRRAADARRQRRRSTER
jgi:membrane protein